MREQDLGRKALLATGLVPEGAVFLGNHSMDSLASISSLKDVIRGHKRAGYQVTIIWDSAFDIHGNQFEGVALVGKKVGRLGAIFSRTTSIDPEKHLIAKTKAEIKELEKGQPEENDCELHALQRELDRIKRHQAKG